MIQSFIYIIGILTDYGKNGWKQKVKEKKLHLNGLRKI